MKEENSTEKTVFIQPLGCLMRLQDSNKLMEFFHNNGFIIVESAALAYYKVIVTCGLNENTITASLKAIDDCDLSYGKIIITGCLPSMSPSSLVNYDNVILIPLSEIETIDTVFAKAGFLYSDTHEHNSFAEEKHSQHDEKNANFGNVIKSFGFAKSRFQQFKRNLRHFIHLRKPKNELEQIKTLRISKGCVSKCSYCAIRMAVGKLKSRPLNDIVADYSILVSKGHSNIMLLADDTGSWGIDLNSTFPELLNALGNCSTKHKVKWHLQDLSPYWALKYENELCDFIAKDCFHEILFSVQSGSNHVLQLMKRHYKTEALSEMIVRIRNINPKMRILSNFIVGFPGETHDDFLQTLQFIKRHSFDFVCIFKYYESEVSDSVNMFPKVDHNIIEERVQIVEELLKRYNTLYVII